MCQKSGGWKYHFLTRDSVTLNCTLLILQSPCPLATSHTWILESLLTKAYCLYVTDSYQFFYFRFLCSVCGVDFRTAWGMTKHMNKSHPMSHPTWCVQRYLFLFQKVPGDQGFMDRPVRIVQSIAAKCSKPEIGRVFDVVYDTNHTRITSAPFYAHLIYVKCPFLLRYPQNTSLLRHNVIYDVIPWSPI